jgi:very-short-patch-repair endonuclease
LLVEIDGSQHADDKDDDVRTEELEASGWRVIRFWNSEVQSNLEGVVRAIMDAGNERLPPGKGFAFVPSRAGRERKPKIRK